MQSARRAALLLLTIMLALPAAAQAPAAGVEPLRVVAGDRFPPFNWIHEGKLAGFGVEVAAELQRRTGQKPGIEDFPFARAIALTRATPNTLLATIARSPERENLFHWIGPLAPREIWLFRLASRPEVNPASIEDARRFRVGVVLGDATVPAMRARGFEDGKNLDVTTKEADALRKLRFNRIDLFPLSYYNIDVMVADKSIQKNEIVPALLLTREGGYYLAVNKDSDARLLASLDAAYAEMVKDGTIKKIAARWLDLPKPAH